MDRNDRTDPRPLSSASAASAAPAASAAAARATLASAANSFAYQLRNSGETEGYGRSTSGGKGYSSSSAAGGGSSGEYSSASAAGGGGSSGYSSASAGGGGGSDVRVEWGKVTVFSISPPSSPRGKHSGYPEDVVVEMLTCAYPAHPSRDAYAAALRIMSENRISSVYMCLKSLVMYPELLEYYLSFGTLHKDDFSSMLARCVEHGTSGWAFPSLKLLLDYAERKRLYMGASLQLMPRRYDISETLYEYCKRAGFYDPCYDADKDRRVIEYPYLSLAQKDSVLSQCVTYRDAIHLLMYGNGRRMELVDWWSLDPGSETVAAARDFFSLETEDKEALTEHILALELSAL